MYRIATRNNETAFEPGGLVSGSIRWSKIPLEVERIEIRLIWFTTGKGDRDVETVDQVTIEKPNQQGDFKFNFQVPVRPYSFSGNLVSLSWAIEVVEFPSLNAENLEIIVAPGKLEIDLYKVSPVGLPKDAG